MSTPSGARVAGQALGREEHMSTTAATAFGGAHGQRAGASRLLAHEPPGRRSLGSAVVAEGSADRGEVPDRDPECPKNEYLKLGTRKSYIAEQRHTLQDQIQGFIPPLYEPAFTQSAFVLPPGALRIGTICSSPRSRPVGTRCPTVGPGASSFTPWNALSGTRGVNGVWHTACVTAGCGMALEGNGGFP